MKIKDVIVEFEGMIDDENSSLQADLNDLLAVAKANKVDNVDPAKLADKLNAMGHSTSADSLVGALQNHPMLQTATTSKAQFKSPATGQISGQDSKNKVGSMALKAAKKTLG